MTPEERLVFQQVGLAMLNNLVADSTQLLLYGVFILLFALSTSALWRCGLEARPTRMMFAITLASFVATTIYIVFGTQVFTAIQYRDDLVNLAVVDKVGRDTLIACAVLVDWMTALLTIISDGVVVWRTWVLYSEQRWVMLAPCALIVSTIVTSLGYLILISMYPTPETLTFALLFARLWIASLSLSLATNVVATLLTFYKLWAYLRFRREMGMHRALRSPVQKVMLLLVESSFVFCAIQGINLLVEFVPRTEQADTASYIVEEVVLSTLQMATAMYPTIVVILVSQQRSLVETFGISSELRDQGAFDIEQHSSRPPTLDLIPTQGIAPTESMLKPSEIATNLNVVEKLAMRAGDQAALQTQSLP